jgi:hypothetical protein
MAQIAGSDSRPAGLARRRRPTVSGGTPARLSCPADPTAQAVRAALMQAWSGRATVRASRGSQTWASA